MFKSTRYIGPGLIVLLIGWFQNLILQDRKPEIALVLRGGGAEGVTHIPLLKALGSLGIIPDLIVGKSIVGRLHAKGYSER